MKQLLVAIVSLFIFSGCTGDLNPFSNKEQPGIIAGYVKCSHRSPLSGIKITLNETGTDVYTNSNGIYSFRDIAPGVYSITIFDEATSTSQRVDNINVISGEETRVSDVIIEVGDNIVPGDTSPVPVSGTVFDADGNYFEGVTITFSSQGLNQQVVTSNSSGMYNNISLQRASYSVTMSFASFRDSTFTLDLTNNQSREYELNLSYVYEKRAGDEFSFNITVDDNSVNALEPFTMRLSHNNTQSSIVRMKFDYIGDGNYIEINDHFIRQRTYTYRDSANYAIRVKLYNEFGFYQVATLNMTVL